ncbi:MAG: hypothetical protein IPI49_19305 [Myxococcales bacterium]|nr:hypothetical protein [Myxococcales bacterium]
MSIGSWVAAGAVALFILAGMVACVSKRRTAEPHSAGQGAASQTIEAQRDLGKRLDALGGEALKASDLSAAKARYEESLRIFQKLAQQNPTSAQAQDDLSSSLGKLGVVALIAGDLPAAKARFAESVSIRQKLAQAIPTSHEAQGDLCFDLLLLGDVEMRAGDLPSARARFEQSLGIAQTLAQGNPTSEERDLRITLERNSVEALRGLGIHINTLGKVAMGEGDLSTAKATFEEGLSIFQKLAQAIPNSAERDLAISFERLGDVALLAGDLPTARARFGQSLDIGQKLAQENPSSDDAQRDLGVSLERLGEVAAAAPAAGRGSLPSEAPAPPRRAQRDPPLLFS